MDICTNNEPLNNAGLERDFIWNNPKRLKVEIKDEIINDDNQFGANTVYICETSKTCTKEEYTESDNTSESQNQSSNDTSLIVPIAEVQQAEITRVPVLITKSKKKKSKKSNKLKIDKNVLPITNLTIEKDDFLKCPLCYKCFEDDKILAHHVWKHKGTNSSLFHQLTYKAPKKPTEKSQSGKGMSSLKCSKCFIEFDNITILKIHIITHIVDNINEAINENQIESRYRCEICYNESFAELDDFKLHLQEHALLVLHKCQVCSKKFMDLAELDAHSKMLNHFTCIICLKSLETESMINEHLEYHLKNKPKSCVYCKKFFYFEIDLNAHIKDLHFSKLSYKCEKCNDVFATVKLKCEHQWKAHYKPK